MKAMNKATESVSEGLRLPKFLRWKKADFVMVLMWASKDECGIEDDPQIIHLRGSTDRAAVNVKVNLLQERSGCHQHSFCLIAVELQDVELIHVFMYFRQLTTDDGGGGGSAVRGGFGVNIDLCVISATVEFQTVLTDDFAGMVRYRR